MADDPEEGAVTTILPREPVIAALREEFAALRDLLAALDPDEWRAPTACPGWDVQAQCAHIIGTESMLLGEDPPEATGADPTGGPGGSHVRNQIGEFNERWVRALADRSPQEMVTMLADVTGRRLEALAALDDEAWNREGFTPAGPDSYGRFMRTRVFDCWLHEQDIRDATGRPGHDTGPVVDLALDELCTALGYVVGKKAAVPAGATVTFRLTGPNARDVHVAVEDRARVVDRLDGPATVTLTMPVGVFARRCGGRVTAEAVAGEVQIDGDVTLGRRILDELAFTI